MCMELEFLKSKGEEFLFHLEVHLLNHSIYSKLRFWQWECSYQEDDFLKKLCWIFWAGAEGSVLYCVESDMSA